MTKRKMLLCAAVLAVAGVVVLFSRETTHPSRSQDSEVAKPSAIAAVQPAQPFVASATPAVSCTNQTPTVRGTLPYVLTSKEPFQKSLRLAVEAMGAKTVSVVSRNALLIEADAATRARLAADGRFEEISEFVPSEKIHPELAALIAGGAKSVDVAIISLAAEYRQLVLSCLAAGGGEMLQGCLNEGDTIRAKLPAELVATLAMRGDVRWMERFVRPQLTNNNAVEPVTMNVRAVWDTHGLTGDGQVVSTSDSGIDTGNLETMHEDLRDRILDMKTAPGCDSVDNNGHGTHTAGSIVGNGTKSEGKIRGTAWGAHLYAWFCAIAGGRGIYTPATCAELFRGNVAGDEWPVFIHSASWGSNTSGAYTTECRNFDQYLWEHPDFLPVVSAGNEGPGKRTVGSPAAAKNVLAVGATMNLRSGNPAATASFSSRGPCQDGRIKPDISAPGCYVTSTKSSLTAGTGYYTSMQGTSMSCPLTAGSVALVRQWLGEKMGYDNPDEPPTAALMKAVIMGGAKGAPVPNQEQGWGRVDLEETLFPSNRAVKLIDRIPFEQDFVTNIVIETTNAAPLDVQLVWVDCPGPRLVNDLDLTVSARVPGEPTVRYGNGGDEPDTVNNAESVRIANAQPTKYVITVTCKDIQFDHTDGGAAALYIRGAFDPDAEVEEPAYVHLKDQGKNFMSLDRALKAITNDNETVEILDWVGFDKSVTLTNDCTIVATNVDPVASRVIPCDDARIVVADGVAVTVSNVVFDVADGVKTFFIATNGVLKVGSASAIEAVETVNANNLVVVSKLTQPFYVDCKDAPLVGDVFAKSAIPLDPATNCAYMMLHPTNTRVGGEAFEDAGIVKFRWLKGAPVPIQKTVAQLDVGKGRVNYRVLSDLFEDYEVAGDVDADIIIRKSTPYDQHLNKKCSITIRGEWDEGGEKPVLALSGKSGFRLEEGASLTIGDVVMYGYDDADDTDDHGFIYVDGGELTLGGGTVLDGFVGRVNAQSGVIDLMKGTVTTLPESLIINCLAKGKDDGGFGGAIYVDSVRVDDEYDCVLNLFGGTITGCVASEFGGGVYVYASEGFEAQINVKGPLAVMDNESPDGSDDLCLGNIYAQPFFTLMGELEGSVGVRYATNVEGLPSGNAVGDAFATNVVGLLSETTLAAFFNDTNVKLVAATNANGMLVWTPEIDEGTCEESDATAHILYEGAKKPLPYANVATAFAFLHSHTNATIEMHKNGKNSETFRSDMVVPEGTKVTLKARDGESYTLLRHKSAGFSVPTGTSLTLTNIVITRDDAAVGLVTNALIDVGGGSLTLAPGACLSKILGNSSRDAGAVTVYDGGTVTMLPGSKISGCENCYNYKINLETGDKNYGCGGGLLVNDGKAFLHGGEIAGCIAVRGGGVYVCNDAEVYVSGDMRITNNLWQNTNGVRQAGNAFVADQAMVYLDGELTGKIGMDAGLRLETDTNLVAKVVDGWEVGVLTNSAAKFVSDATDDVGVAVTNGTKALIVWSAAARDGVYTNATDGLVYGVPGWLALETPVSVPDPLPVPSFTVATNTPVALAFESIVPADAFCTLTLTDLVAGVKYAIFATNTLEGGFGIEGVEPVTNFTAESDGPCELILPVDPAHVFWRATATETYKTNYIDKVD